MNNILDFKKKAKEEKKEEKKGRHPARLNWSMFRMLFICWILPLVMLSVGIQIYTSVKSREQMEESIIESSNKALISSLNNVETVIQVSRNASYMGQIRQSYIKYREDGEYQELYNSVQQFLNSQYRYNSLISETIVYLTENPGHIFYTYSNVAGATYAGIQEFSDKAFYKSKEIAEKLDTKIAFFTSGDRLYLVRNLVMPDYTPFAVIIMELNTEAVFGNFRNILWFKDYYIYVNDELLKNGTRSDNGQYSRDNYINNSCLYERGSSTVYASVETEMQVFNIEIVLDTHAMLVERDGIAVYFFIICLLLLPLIYIMFHFFYRNVSVPINELVDISHEIEGGNFGVKLPKFDSNYEFNLLVDTFNNMSANLKDLFEKIYSEELALRDANIMALQSQINPHFMNNTLEIINWQARMEGNENVCKMIEALSIMLEATMDRKRERLVPLAEEMQYVEAYLYIISVRYGELFSVEKHVEEEALEFKVPRLIIQPVIENAVEHGGDIRGFRKVRLNIYHDEGGLNIDIENNGKITYKDRILIDNLLADRPVEGEKAHNLGIRNVNKRLKMLFGAESGLTIDTNEEGNVLSRIHIHNK